MERHLRTEKIYTTVLMDLDGTLVDSATGITRSVQYALNHFGIKEEDPAKLYRFIGPPLQDSFREFCGFTETQAREAVQKYRERYAVRGIYENEVYKGIEAVLGFWKMIGKRLMVCTSKPEPFAREILENLGLSPYFAFIGGADFDGKRDGKADVIRYVLSENHIENLEETVMVGDRKYDVLGAAELGIDSVGVLYGYGSRPELEQAGATYIVSAVSELKDRIV